MHAKGVIHLSFFLHGTGTSILSIITTWHNMGIYGDWSFLFLYNDASVRHLKINISPVKSEVAVQFWILSAVPTVSYYNNADPVL